jgi:hypothetical protein
MYLYFSIALDDSIDAARLLIIRCLNDRFDVITHLPSALEMTNPLPFTTASQSE